jgi:hypothetical protein
MLEKLILSYDRLRRAGVPALEFEHLMQAARLWGRLPIGRSLTSCPTRMSELQAQAIRLSPDGFWYH